MGTMTVIWQAQSHDQCTYIQRRVPMRSNMGVAFVFPAILNK